MKSKQTKMMVTVKVKGKKEGAFADGFKNLYAFARLPNDPGKVLGKAGFNARGEAKIDITMPGNVPMPLEIEVSPLSKAMTFKNIKTEKTVAREFKKTDSKYTADLSVDLSPSMYAYTDWLNEQFTVSGKLISHYVDPETEADCTVGVPYSKVTLFEVDRKRVVSPCLVNCMVYLPPSDCIPGCNPIGICPPIIEAPQDCMPIILDSPRTCIPNMPCRPSWIERIEGIDEIIQWERDAIAGKASMAKTLQKPVAKKSAGPLRSPALPLSCASNPAGTMTVANKCLPAFLNTCIPDLCGVSVLPLQQYSKTELGSDETDANGNYFITFRRSDFLEAAAGSTQTENVDWDAWPDLLFEASRFFDGEMRVIYQEGYDQTRWDIQNTSLNVNLIIEGQVPGVLCSPDETLDPSQTEAFVFHGIGNVEPGWIDANGVITNVPNTHSYYEHVFGSTLDLFGQFKYEHINNYYQVEYASASAPNDWKPIANETWTYSRYLGNFTWEEITKAPVDLGPDFPYCYQIPDYTDHIINRKTLIMKWRTWRRDGGFPRYPDGQYTFRIRLLTPEGNIIEDLDPVTTEIAVTLDNTWPEADIKPDVLVYDKGAGPGVYSQIPECGSVASADRYLVFRFKAQDGQKHFKRYYFTVNRGAEDAVYFTAVNALDDGPAPPNVGLSLVQPSVIFSDANDNYPDNYTWLYIGKDFWDEATYGSFRPCAYNFRLVVWDRVTNGYGLIHWSDSTLTLSIT